MRPIRRATCLVSTLAMMSGCTILDTARQEREIADTADRFQAVRPASDDKSAVALTGKPFFGSRVVRVGHGAVLPAGLAAQRFTLRRANPLTLEQAAEALSLAAGHFPIRVDGRAETAAPGPVPNTAPAAAILARANGNALPPPPGLNHSSGNAPPTPETDFAFVPDFRDMPLETILDGLCEHFDCEWRYADGRVTISRLVSRVFEVRADPSVKQI